VCRERLGDLFSEEEGFVPTTQFDILEWYRTTHPVTEPKCDLWPVHRASIQFQREIINASETRSKVLGILHDLADLSGLTRARLDGQNALRVRQVSLALELIGPNPFRPVAFDFQWRTSTVFSLARQMYESRDFSAMPILADALQDAGCDNDAILSHCRGTGPHVRCCWVCDLVLGKA